MSNAPRKVTRNQLADFLPDPRAIRAFEQIMEQVSTLLPEDIATLNRLIQETYIEAASSGSRAQTALDLIGSAAQTAAINAGIADAKAVVALDALSSIARSLDILSKAPSSQANNSIVTDYIDFALAPPYAATPGRVHWGSTGTLEIEMGNGNITQQVGEEFFIYGKASAAITEGQLIMVTGTVGASGAVTFAPTSMGLLDPNVILGIATENIALNGFGRVTTMGVVHGLNTSGSSVGEVWADGDVLWYNTGFVGGMTKVKPVAPNMKTQVAVVLRAGSGSSGTLQVEVLNGSSLGGTDNNVQLSALMDKQLLQYDAVAGYWKNVAVSAIGSTAAETHAAASKSTPVDADEIPLADSAASFALKKLTWANLKATLATWINANLIPASFTTVTSNGPSTVDGVAAGTNVYSLFKLNGVNAAILGSDASIFGGSANNFGMYLYGAASEFFVAPSGGKILRVNNAGITVLGAVSVAGGASFITTTAALTNGAGIGVGTLLNAPVAGNPTKWIGINDNGTTRYIPSW